MIQINPGQILFINIIIITVVIITVVIIIIIIIIIIITGTRLTPVRSRKMSKSEEALPLTATWLL